MTMRTNPFVLTLATLLAVVLVVPSTLLIAPRTAQAAYPVVIVGDTSPTSITQTAKSIITSIQTTLTAMHSATSAVADYANWVRTYILEPLAFVLSGNLIKMLTASVISFVIGKANGTGIPQFVVDVQKSIQTVQDYQTAAFLRQMQLTNSPFASSVQAVLGEQYLRNSSLAGYWEANMCTLAASSPSYTPAFLRGDWSQGGVSAWFALTTEDQNNPYTFTQAAQMKLTTVIGTGVGGASGVRMAQLNWGQGFLSWCGPIATQGQTCSDVNGNMGTLNAGGVCVTVGSSPTTTTCSDVNGNLGVLNSAGQCVADSSAVVTGINPGDPCTQGDGSPGVIRTPGSTIKSTLDKVLGAEQDKLVQMGNISTEINGIMSDIASVYDTVNLASNILGGSGSNSGGLLGVDSGSGSSVLSRFAGSGALGVTQNDVYKNAISSSPATADIATRITDYSKAWNTINTAAQTASSSVASLAAACTQVADGRYTSLFGSDSTWRSAARDQAAAAQTALTTIIAPVLARVTVAESIVSAANAMVLKVQQESATSASGSTSSTYTADLQALQTMQPTATDVVQAQTDATANPGLASATPDGSLNVSTSDGSSIVDQMNLLIVNANRLKTTVCTTPVQNSYF